MHLGPPLLPRREGLSGPPSHMLATLTLATAGEEGVDMNLEQLSTMTLAAGEEEEVVVNLEPPMLHGREGLSGPPSNDTSLETSIDQVTNGAHLYSLLEARSMQLAFGYLMIMLRPKP